MGDTFAWAPQRGRGGRSSSCCFRACIPHRNEREPRLLTPRCAGATGLPVTVSRHRSRFAPPWKVLVVVSRRLAASQTFCVRARSFQSLGAAQGSLREGPRGLWGVRSLSSQVRARRRSGALPRVLRSCSAGSTLITQTITFRAWVARPAATGKMSPWLWRLSIARWESIWTRWTPTRSWLTRRASRRAR